MSYLNLRLINEETQEHFNLTELEINGENYVKIPYRFNEDNTKSINYNLRIGKKANDNKYNNDFLGDFKNSFFNIDRIDWNQDLYITIGEFNAMVLWQLKYKNVIGLNTNNIEDSNIAFKKYSDKFKLFKHQKAKLFLVQSNTQFGRSMSKVVKKCLPFINLVDIKKYGDLKDVNELLVQSDNHVHVLLRSFYGGLIDIINLSNFNIDELYENFSPKISWGIDWLNTRFNGLEKGRVYGITGPTGHGKSVLTNQCILNALNEEEKQKVLIVDGEERIEDRIYNLYYPLVANVTSDINKYVNNAKDGFITKSYIKPDVTKKIQLWHKNKLFLYCANYKSVRIKTDILFEKIKETVLHDGVNMVVIDNLMSLNNDERRETLEAQFNFVSQCQTLAKRYNCIVLLCMHLKKYKDINDVTTNDICGSSNIVNLLDNLVLIYRDIKEDDPNGKTFLRILKNRSLGKFGKCEVIFNNKYFNEFDPVSKVQYKSKIDSFIPFLKPDEEQKNYMDEIESMEQQLLNF